HLSRERRHDGVDQDRERNAGRIGIARIAVDLDHADLLGNVHLGGREPSAAVLAHGLDHVVDQPLDLARPDFLDRNRRRHFPQHRMPEPGDLQDGHVLSPAAGLYHTGPGASAPPAFHAPLMPASTWTRTGAARTPRDTAAGRPRPTPG